ncbi:arsenate reductase family protein [Spirochaeta isovalerica]|uniref:Arsenate reductase-like glutaredoxin family protein n=1 Tax=Spirochaeta isovalerica TaxID=150 RepID=A0A841RDG6_9SPIO|nr:arsenate reductase family protein [Spirochaeta isovalerica]MBB6481277.1 arsenate reductase-like glutaredoxin family protein [Spirochaeta isovalerica]
MNIQIIGTKKCSDTKKAMRFFKERNVSYHFLDLGEKPLSRGELIKIAQKLGGDNLIDTQSKAYKDKGLAWMDYDAVEEVMENNLLLKTPVVRNGNEVTAGIDQKTWTLWIKEGK